MESTKADNVNTRDQNQNVESAVTELVDRSPSIVHNESSSFISSMHTSTTTHKIVKTHETTSTVKSETNTAFTSSEAVNINESTTSNLTVFEEEGESALYDSKVQLGSNKSVKSLSYGPTFKEASVTKQEETLLTATYSHNSKDTESVLTKHGLGSNIRDKLKWYRRTSNTTLVDVEKGKDEKYIASSINEDELGIKSRSLLYRQFFGDAKYPVLTWLFALTMISYFVYELVRNRQLSGHAIQTNPFNPMIGPNYVSLITMKSKFTPCMTNVAKYPPSYSLGNCYSLNATCTIETACGGFNGGIPNQTSRFIEALFVHAGVVHLILNLMAHFHAAPPIERALGSVRFAFLYIGSGVWGFILSGTLSGSLTSSMGCSGALFGLLGYELVEAIRTWKDVRHPRSRLLQLIALILISLAIGLLPGLDNFAHIGGLVMGILLSVLLSSIHPFPTIAATIITWASKFISLIAVIALYIAFLSIFFTSEDLDSICPNCKYLSCIPASGWCDI